MTESKKIVDLQMWRQDRTSLEAKGRFLGLVTDRQLALMIKEKSFSKRLSTVATMSISILGEMTVSELKGTRMLFAAKEIDSEVLNSPVLLVSNNVDFVSHANVNDITVTCDNGGYVLMQEGY